ncbi:MAG TPA: amphi-Trp domain-containing protein [Amycolatopsis sp.]|nr:amphi-Trp domain-containing protein [Amycolatopsis sp.]
MSILKVTREEMLSRAAAARLLSTLAAALANSDQLQVTLGGSSIKVQVPDEVRCEIEVEVDRDEVELEVELKWPTSDHDGSPQGET